MAQSWLTTISSLPDDNDYSHGSTQGESLWEKSRKYARAERFAEDVHFTLATINVSSQQTNSEVDLRFTKLQISYHSCTLSLESWEKMGSNII